MATFHNPIGVCNSKYKVNKVLIDKGDYSWCLAKAYRYEDKKEHYVIRWNGGSTELGFPNTMGNPTWFQIPDEIGNVIEDIIKLK